MTLYIACTSDSGVRIVRLEGWLEGEGVAELERVVSGSSGPLRLDLSELRSSDTPGLAALRALRAAGASIVGASPYIKLLLGSWGQSETHTLESDHWQWRETVPFLLPGDETFDVGVDTRTPVNDSDYQVPFRFNGTINKVTFNLGPAQLTEEDQRTIREAIARARD